MLALLADTVSESKDIILIMLVVGLLFIAIIAVGETLHWLSSRRKARRRARRPVY